MSNGLSSLLWFIAILALIPATPLVSQAHAARRRRRLGRDEEHRLAAALDARSESSRSRSAAAMNGAGWCSASRRRRSRPCTPWPRRRSRPRRPAQPATFIRPSPRSSAVSAGRAPEATTMPAERIALAAQRRENEALSEHFRRSGGPKRIAWLGLLVLVAVALVVVALPASAQPTHPAAKPACRCWSARARAAPATRCRSQTLLFLTALTFLPAVLLLMTSFTRIVIVLSLLRQALGTQAAPPNQVVIGLSLFLTLLRHGPDHRQGLRRRLPARTRPTRSPSTRRSGAAQSPLRDVHAEADARARPRAVRQAGADRPPAT